MLRGCGTVVIFLTSYARSPQFEFSHRQFLEHCLLTILPTSEERRQRELGIVLFRKKCLVTH